MGSSTPQGAYLTAVFAWLGQTPASPQEAEMVLLQLRGAEFERILAVMRDIRTPTPCSRWSWVLDLSGRSVSWRYARSS
jgi:hypothetical protein